MSDTCPRCDQEVRLLDPHRNCPGPPWVVGVPIEALVGPSAKKVVLAGLLPNVNSVRDVLLRAVELTGNIVCRCDYCWTSRGRHDPKGCLWEELEPLRDAVAKMQGDNRTNAPKDGG